MEQLYRLPHTYGQKIRNRAHATTSTSAATASARENIDKEEEFLAAKKAHDETVKKYMSDHQVDQKAAVDGLKELGQKEPERKAWSVIGDDPTTSYDNLDKPDDLDKP